MGIITSKQSTPRPEPKPVPAAAQPCPQQRQPQQQVPVVVQQQPHPKVEPTAPPQPYAPAAPAPVVTGPTPTSTQPAPKVTWENAAAPVMSQEELNKETQRRESRVEQKDRKKSRAEAAQSDNNMTPELLNEFIANEKEIQELEGKRADEKHQMLSIEHTTITEALEKQTQRVEELKVITMKEYKDVAEFNVQQYMSSHEMSFVSDEDIDAAKQKEESEYIEAAGTQEVAEKELANLEIQLVEHSAQMEATRQDAERLTSLRLRMDGLLENIFNNSYGSDLEDRLELEVEQLLQLKQHVSVAHFKWWNGRKLIFNACSQMAYACRRWAQIGQMPDVDMAGKYEMCTDVRNNMIAAHQNSQRAIEYLTMKLPYWTYDEDKNMINSINVMFNDLRYKDSYKKALAWYKFYHWKLALQLNWMDQTINNKIVVDHKRYSREFQQKYRELRIERLRLIKAKAKEFLNVDIDVDELIQKHGDASMDDDGEELITMESNMGIMPDAMVGGTAPTPNAQEGDDPTQQVDYDETRSEDGGAGSRGPPLIKFIPLEDLAPAPTSDDLFGNVAQLQSQHKKEIEDFEKEQEANKTRMDVSLAEKLAARRSQRRRKELQTQEPAVEPAIAE